MLKEVASSSPEDNLVTGDRVIGGAEQDKEDTAAHHTTGVNQQADGEA